MYSTGQIGSPGQRGKSINIASEGILIGSLARCGNPARVPRLGLVGGRQPQDDKVT